MMDTDEAAMQRLSAGEDLALNEIMSRWQQRLASFLLRMTGNRAAASDLAQETFVRLYEGRSSYKPSGAFSSYIFRISANLARNHIRWRKRHPEEALEIIYTGGFEPITAELSPDRNLEKSEAAREVRRALRTLPDELREALVLFTYDELGYAEIASIAGCSTKAAETRIYRARQILKQKLSHLSTSETLPEGRTTSG
jgi:RNA polymerase sigma-70 factor (ECF subfamily)